MSTQPLHNEKELLIEIASGNETAFHHIYNWYAPRLYSLALMYCKSHLTAQDVVQETFLRTWTRRTELPQITNFGGYLQVITRNLVITTLRKKLPLFQSDLEKNNSMEEDVWKPAEQLEAKQVANCIRAAINQLPAQQQQVYLLGKETGSPLKEVAMRLNISYNTAREHMSRALKSIRNFIKDCLK